MSGCLDNLQIPNIDVGEKRNKYASIISGVLFFTGWWFALDAAAVHPEKTELKDVFQICGVFGTISFFMVNAVSNGQLRGESYTEGCLGVRSARVWFFLGFLLGFGSLIGASWILFGEYVTNDCYAMGVKYQGNGLSNNTQIVQECQMLCRNAKKCSYFTWGDATDPTTENCILFEDKPQETDDQNFISGPANCPDGRTFVPTISYPGVAIFLQNFLIFVASLVYKFGRSEELWS
jgi:hypothetical protein